MIDFRDADQKNVFMYFADLLNNELALAIAKKEKEITSKEEAEALTQFYWEIVD